MVPTTCHDLTPWMALSGVNGRCLWARHMHGGSGTLASSMSSEGVPWHTVGYPRVSPCWGFTRLRDLFQSREAGTLGQALSKTHFILESILSTAWKAASLLCTCPFLSNRECLSASKHLIKKATLLFKPFYFVWDGCLLLSLCSPPCRLRFRLRLTKTRLSLITYWGSRIPWWEPTYMFCLVMHELTWTSIASAAAVLLFTAELDVLWQRVQVACPRSAWADWEMTQKCFMEQAPALCPPLI